MRSLNLTTLHQSAAVPGKNSIYGTDCNLSAKIETKPENFNGLKNVTEISGQDQSKYATGSFSDYMAAVSYRKEIEAIFPDAFVIAVKDNKILPLQQALDEMKEIIKRDTK